MGRTEARTRGGDARRGRPRPGPAAGRGPEAGAAREHGPRALLEVTLEAAVPLRILELRHASGEERVRLAREASGHIAEHGDLILYRGPCPGGTARAVGWLITGLACAAYQPGGVRFGSRAWCAAHPAHRWAAEDQICARCLAEEAQARHGNP